MARVNNDVVGSQQAITSTLAQRHLELRWRSSATLAIMLALEWRLTVLGVVDPAPVHPARPAASASLLRRVTREAHRPSTPR